MSARVITQYLPDNTLSINSETYFRAIPVTLTYLPVSTVSSNLFPCHSGHMNIFTCQYRLQQPISVPFRSH